MKEEFYKTSGRFSVFDQYKTLVTDQLFVNKIFKAYFPAAARNMAITYAKRRAVKKYGKGVTIEQIGNLRVQKSHEPKKRKKKTVANKNVQEKLF